MTFNHVVRVRFPLAVPIKRSVGVNGSTLPCHGKGTGSKPVQTAIFWGLAQSLERSPDKTEVTSSILVSPTNFGSVAQG